MYAKCILQQMSKPVTVRLDEEVVQAIDNAVACGIAPNRSAIVSWAVREWLSHHCKEAIVASYRKLYGASDPEEQELITKLGTLSATISIESAK
jgi:Arc/MetJ-type ribon-helix-helix transcriptional regulator